MEKLLVILFLMVLFPVLSMCYGQTRTLHIRNVHTGVKFEGVYWEGGIYKEEALRMLDEVFRDHHSGEKRKIHYKLIDYLGVLYEHHGRRRLDLISGYRSEKTNAELRRKSKAVAKDSYHLAGMAADVRIPGVSTQRLFESARAKCDGGVGRYLKSRFVHIDTGPSRSW